MQLGSLGFEVADLAAWHTFFTDVLGLVGVGGGRYRMDGHAWRFQLTEGPADDLLFVGWELEPDELDATLARLETAGVAVSAADPSARGVARRYVLQDPAGIAVELSTGPTLATEPFVSPVVPRGFVGDALGLGHLVLSTVDKDASVRFYTELLGAKLSDHIVTEFFGHKVDISFFHVNPRHHSVAFGGPQKKRLHHFLLEARTMDDVGLAFDRALKGGVRIFQTLGRHPNDRMFSFYAYTPSGFQFEFGAGGCEIDDALWATTTYDQISEWGHHPIRALTGR